MADITVYNHSGSKKEVAINHWGDSGSTKFYPIDDDKSASWSRSDKMGYVMVVTDYKEDRSTGSYWYVGIDKPITINSLGDVKNAQRLTSPY